MLLKWVISDDEKQVATLCGMGGGRAGIETSACPVSQDHLAGPAASEAQASTLLYIGEDSAGTQGRGLRLL